MAKSENKTKPTDVTVEAFLDALPHKNRHADSASLLNLFGRITGWTPQMWGPTIIGYGRYRYKYASGREGEYMVTGFSPRKAAMTIYVLPGYRDLDDKLARLGKHKIGKSCLYINKLTDIDMAVLEEIIADGVAYMKSNYETFAR